MTSIHGIQSLNICQITTVVRPPPATPPSPPQHCRRVPQPTPSTPQPKGLLPEVEGNRQSTAISRRRIISFVVLDFAPTP
ncbi:hypothetical protein AAHA92_13639 [Salvia divinorum]|uniref:Uncharacterized protein n=1 Tax=Salvia divinorum TaxID=28513 RepID=A0ABD1H903_SALDI